MHINFLIKLVRFVYFYLGYEKAFTFFIFIHPQIRTISISCIQNYDNFVCTLNKPISWQFHTLISEHCIILFSKIMEYTTNRRKQKRMQVLERKRLCIFYLKEKSTLLHRFILNSKKKVTTHFQFQPYPSLFSTLKCFKYNPSTSIFLSTHKNPTKWVAKAVGPFSCRRVFSI